MNPSDDFNGHDVDSVDVWPMITGVNLTNPREYLPITEQTIIWKGQYKYFTTTHTELGFHGWSTRNNTMYGEQGWVDVNDALYDILTDPTERHEISSAHPDIVASLSAELAKFAWYVNASMSPEELAPYNCAKLKANAHDWPLSWPWLDTGIGSQQAHAFDSAAKGPLISETVEGKSASWPATDASCNQVALMHRSEANKTFWVQLEAHTRWIDIGFCSPSIPLNLSGSDPSAWMGDQVSVSGDSLAWIYRANGLFRVAASKHSPGAKYDAGYSGSSNVTAIYHSPTLLEFEVDGNSRGTIALPAGKALPHDAVGCVGICGGGAASLYKGPGMKVFAGPCCRRKSV